MLTAVVSATEGSLNWLGSKPIVCWVLETLCEVRGVDRVVLLSPKDTVLPVIEGITVIPVEKLPQNLTEMAAVVGLEVGATWAEVHAGAVFLRAETIESAVAAVINDGKSAAVTVSRLGRIVERQGTSFRTVSGALCETRGCRVWADCVHTTEEILGRGGVPVEIDGLELLDAVTPHGARMARALVETGRVH